MHVFMFSNYGHNPHLAPTDCVLHYSLRIRGENVSESKIFQVKINLAPYFDL